jgi:hypothetical protein
MYLIPTLPKHSLLSKGDVTLEVVQEVTEDLLVVLEQRRKNVKLGRVG